MGGRGSVLKSGVGSLFLGIGKSIVTAPVSCLLSFPSDLPYLASLEGPLSAVRFQGQYRYGPALRGVLTALPGVEVPDLNSRRQVPLRTVPR